MKKISLAISPCPNDLFLFSPWIKGYVANDITPDVTYADIQQLNNWAFEKKFPFIKVSFFAFAQLQKHYNLFPVGVALGFGCGPLIISKIPCSVEQVSQMKVAIPGEMTTAHLLFQAFAPPPKEKIFCSYEQIFNLLNQGIVDAGVIIHESRFTFKKAGFHEMADLGALWEKSTALPLPLGGLAISKEIPPEIVLRLTEILKKSYDFAKSHPQKIENEILKFSQEKDLEVINSHIELYVNDETRSLSSLGEKAIETFMAYVEKTYSFCPSL